MRRVRMGHDQRGILDPDREKPCDQCGELLQASGTLVPITPTGPKIGLLLRVPAAMTAEEVREAELSPEKRAKKALLVPNEEFQELCPRCYAQQVLKIQTREMTKCEVCQNMPSSGRRSESIAALTLRWSQKLGAVMTA